jgi:uncharacterized protein (TIGR04255 family)
MSKLPNAPLIEVILEFRWTVTNNTDLSKIQYLYGDLYNDLKEKYPYREAVFPIALPNEFTLNNPIHRYRTAKDDYPLYQVGPGIITLNTIDSKYDWDEFSSEAEQLLNSFIAVQTQLTDKLIPSLTYIDFIAFDFEKNNVMDYINENFNLKFEQSFINSNKTNDLKLGFNYEIEVGNLTVMFSKGNNKNNETGIAIQTNIKGKAHNLDSKILIDWLGKAHGISSEMFKKLTAGKLYESFK